MFRIGEFSKRTNVPIKTLRFYDEVGLLRPTVVDNATGYRYYSPDLLVRLNRILALKQLGFSLDEISLLIDSALPANRVREMLRFRRAELKRSVERDKARLAQVDSWLSRIEQDGCVPDHEIVLREVPAQLVASVRDKISSYDEARYLFDELDCHLKQHNIQGQQAAIWHACFGQVDRVDCEALAVLPREVPESKRVAVYEIPASLNACLVYQGTDDLIAQAYVAARSWIAAHGYTIAGPLSELYWQGGVSQDQAPGVTEIRYPVLKSSTHSSAGH